jgi:uncharacterized protein (DUF488 family)
LRFFTVGHSNRSLEEFRELLKKYGIDLLIDVRSVPFSSRHPHFSKPVLSKALEGEGIDYLHLPELGGFRKEGYTEYMKTDAFRKAVDKLITLSMGRKSVLMCAEKDWNRCHRRFIARELVSRGHEVLHLLTFGKFQTHPRNLY